jgi:hypothetical protein
MSRRRLRLRDRFRVTSGVGFCLKAHRSAHEAATLATAAPWSIVPADRKWLTRLVVVAAIVEAREGLDLHHAEPAAAERTALAEARALLA